MTNFEIRTVDLPAFINQISRQTVGFESLFDKLNQTFATTRNDNYPPHNVVQYDDAHYAIELAVAGFAEDDVTIELNKNVLTVIGAQRSDGTIPPAYLHKGISNRDFTRTFPLADHIEVTGAKVRNGILTISLERVVPEELKPKTIAITYDK